ncbi:MAG: MazG-like family protein [Firmicutes bacterium]|nr:MazG-like family protein [Bacillota bacterium]
METKTLSLPRLNGLRPTLESTALKLMEEAGELAEAIGKFRSLSGERAPAGAAGASSYDAIVQELLDVAQTAVTMMFVLEEQHGVDLRGVLRRHLQKLVDKGYLDAPKDSLEGGAAGAPAAAGGDAAAPRPDAGVGTR